jgi:hypothetical protein
MEDINTLIISSFIINPLTLLNILIIIIIIIIIIIL